MWVVFSTLQDGASPLAVASQNGHREIVQTLIDCGANVNSQQKVCIIFGNSGIATLGHAGAHAVATSSRDPPVQR